MKLPLLLSEPVCLAPVGDLCGEGALWHPEHQALYWTDINRFLIHRLKPGADTVETWSFDEPVTALTLTTRNDTIIAVLATRIIHWRPTNDDRVTIFHLPSAPEARCNDARVDPAGVLWVETMQNNVAADGSPTPIDRKIGELFSFAASGEMRVWRTGLGIGNTVVWSPQSEHLYTADTLTNQIFRWNWHPDSTVSGEVLWHSGDPRGLPDGSTIDVDGFLWNCRYGGGHILRIATDGRLERAIPMPVANPTTCVFGGPDGTTLYVTSAAMGDASAEAGGLFAIETNTHGLVENRFKL